MKSLVNLLTAGVVLRQITLAPDNVQANLQLKNIAADFLFTNNLKRDISKVSITTHRCRKL
jgi:hypothetical protein